MVNYQNSKIYTIRCKWDDALIYVGSTTQPLCKRMVEHRSKHDKAQSDSFTKPLYVKMRELGVENFFIELYKDFPCERKEQLEKEEGDIIRQIGTLNRVIAGIRYRENTNDYNKTYWQENKETLRESNKIYRSENRERIKEIDRQRYLKNKEKYQEKVMCDCGVLITKYSLSNHMKTQKHKNALGNIEV